MGEVVSLSPTPKEGVRFVGVVDAVGQFVVSIHYWDGGRVFAGAFFGHCEALESARRKAASLGCPVADFSFDGDPVEGDAA
ncbi:hypothetical protein BH10PSE12_BH10PSE12_36500 [soil metagenome]